LSAVHLAALLICQSGAWAQSGSSQALEPIKLKPSLTLDSRSPDANTEPAFIRADSLQGRPSLDTIATGQAEMRKRSIIVKSDRLEYYQPDDLVKAKGNVRIVRNGDLYTGPELELKVDAFSGHFLNPSYNFLRNDSSGQARRLDFIDDKRSIAYDTTFSTCKPEPQVLSWVPDWVLKATKIHFDLEDESGRAEDVRLQFKDVTILSLPAMGFPLTDKRKSGVLPPSINLDNVSGFETTLPYYWDIAPNRDLTLYPTLKTKRGLQLGSEFRYLEADYTGQVKLDYLPNDRLRSEDRWAYTLKHQGLVQTIGGHSAIGLQLNLNRVSDDNYWKDSPRGTTSLTQRLLSNDVSATWQQGEFKAQIRTIKWQTLQDAASPIINPYDKLPNLNARWHTRLYGLDFDFEGDHARFSSNPVLTAQPNADRNYFNTQISYLYRVPGGHIIPKLQYDFTQYRFAPYNVAASTWATGTITRTVPTYSLDAGLVFERPSNLWGNNLIQTLEPRLLWTRTPYRDQSYLPVYDTSAKDFNLANIWTENEYVGHDRISATHSLTVGASSRLLADQTGEELARLSAAQRLRFADQDVTLPGAAPATARLSDLLMGVGINWNRQWAFDGTVQYSPDLNRSVRTTMVARYQPGNYRVIHAAYRLNEGASEQLDVGWQWPLDDLWRDKGDAHNIPGAGLGPGRIYTVGRINYSMQDRRIVDSIFGLEYDSGCWLTRVVLERVSNGVATATNRIMLQLELSGFSRLGTNPTGVLKTHIPGYQFLRERSLVSPNRFTTYE
jgi:LPS-assembly protein